MSLPLGILDQSPIVAGGTAEEAVAATVALVREAEELGYARYWFAEHHGRAHNYASAAPEVLIAHLSARTQRIRLGSGGVLISHYSALKVAETFRLLEALAPGRVDLGIGGGTGSSDAAERALGAGLGRDGPYAARVREVLGFLEKPGSGAEPHPGVVAAPVIERSPQIWLLGSTQTGARLAGELGLPFAFAHFIKGDAPDVTAAYRTSFRPSVGTDRARVILAVAAFCSPDSASRNDYLTTLAVRRARVRVEDDPLPLSAGEARTYVPSAAERVHYDDTLRLAVAAHPASIRDRLEEIAGRHTADELLVVSVTPDAESRRRSYAELAAAWS